jgi:hypothetical protein
MTLHKRPVRSSAFGVKTAGSLLFIRRCAAWRVAWHKTSSNAAQRVDALLHQECQAERVQGVRLRYGFRMDPADSLLSAKIPHKQWLGSQ